MTNDIFQKSEKQLCKNYLELWHYTYSTEKIKISKKFSIRTTWTFAHC